jgi:methionyl-tRNA formyltransferase
MAGQVLEIDGTGMLVACGDGAVRVLQVQAPGKRRNSALEFARGRGVAVGDVLGNAR